MFFIIFKKITFEVIIWGFHELSWILCFYSLDPARGECEASGMGEWREGLPGDMPCMRGDGPETCGELGQVPVLWLGDTMGYGELGSRAPTVQ